MSEMVYNEGIETKMQAGAVVFKPVKRFVAAMPACRVRPPEPGTLWHLGERRQTMRQWQMGRVAPR